MIYQGDRCKRGTRALGQQVEVGGVATPPESIEPNGDPPPHTTL